MIRLCLKCGKPFESTGPGHRLDAKCNAQNAKQSPAGARGRVLGMVGPHRISPELVEVQTAAK